MTRVPWTTISLASLGSCIALAATLLFYINAHRAGVAGGYFPLAAGAVSVGALTVATAYFSAPKPRRFGLPALAVGTLVSLAVAGLLLATLISAFGT